MKIAVTGASGHLGAAILPILINSGYSVKALVRDAIPAVDSLPIEIVNGDLLHTDTLYALLKNCTALIHCAAVISVNGDPGGIVHQTNVEGTKKLLETAQQCGIKRVVHISSIHAYEQQTGSMVLDEQSRLVNEHAFAYDRSKKAGQEFALSMNSETMEVLVMNPTSIIGPYDYKPSKMGKVIIDLYNGRLPFIFNGGFDFCNSTDVASAVVNALNMGTPGQNYILSGKWHSLQELTTFLSAAAQKKIKPFMLPEVIGKAALPIVKLMASVNKRDPLYTIEAMEALYTGNKNISSDKAKQQLCYTVQPFEKTILDTLTWFKKIGYIV